MRNRNPKHNKRSIPIDNRRRHKFNTPFFNWYLDRYRWFHSKEYREQQRLKKHGIIEKEEEITTPVYVMPTPRYESENSNVSV